MSDRKEYTPRPWPTTLPEKLEMVLPCTCGRTDSAHNLDCPAWRRMAVLSIVKAELVARDSEWQEHIESRMGLRVEGPKP